MASHDRPQRGRFSLLPPLIGRRYVTETGMTSREVAILHSLANFFLSNRHVWSMGELFCLVFCKSLLSASRETAILFAYFEFDVQS